MRYADGQHIQLGDKVRLGSDDGGVVVCDISARLFSSSHPESEWGYLSEGVVIEFPEYGIIHMKVAEPGLELVAR